MPLKTGTCATCAADKVKLRSNPFSNAEECEDCRKSGPKAIIGITDIKEYKLKDTEVDGLQMVKEDKPAFVGGPPYRWYLLKEVEKRAAEVEKVREKESAENDAELKAKAAEKEKKATQKEEEKMAKAAERAKKAAEREAEKEKKAEEKKRKRVAKDANDSGIAKRVPKAKRVATPARTTPRRAAANKKSIVDNDRSDED